MKHNFRHIDNNLLLGLWLLIKANQGGKSVIRLENAFLKTLFQQSRVSDKQLENFKNDTQHIFPFQRPLFVQSKTVLDLCTHELPEPYYREIHPVSRVPTIEQMEADLGIQWKCVMVTDYDPRTKS